MLTPYPKEDKKPDKKPDVKEKKKVERVLKCKEFGRMLDFGLGRGVNATHNSPWLQKSTFQVREVSPHNIVGTEEGGILKSFIREIWSIEKVQSLLSASVPVSDKVSIGIDAELNRSYNMNRRSIGQSLITRTISFKPDFELDQQVTCNCEAEPKEKDAECASESDEENTSITVASHPTFEERLAVWIINKVNELTSDTKLI